MSALPLRHAPAGRRPGFRPRLEALEDRLTPAATEAWVARYDGPATGTITNEDTAQAVAVDASGNVYVSGTSEGNSPNGFSNWDYLTAKYDAAGNLLWTARYDAGAYDFCYDMAIDADGNVYVTGASQPGDVNAPTDYLTVKYDTDGVQQWTARYATIGGDNPWDLEVDANGDVYVTGQVQPGGAFTPLQYLTVKYDTDDGTQSWAVGYASPGSGGSAYGWDLAVDGSGNVYVTGSSQTNGMGTFPDYVTIKYNSIGVAQWTALYNGPMGGYDTAAAVGVDGSGNVYVTGSTAGYGGSSPGYLTVKYSSTGTQLWTASYPWGGGTPSAMAVDTAGNVFVVGTGGLVAYDTYGSQLWTGGGGRALALDASGNVYVTGSYQPGWSGTDYYTVKYNSSGTPVWGIGYNGTASDLDDAVAVAVDASGNVYVTGQSFGTDLDAPDRDIVTIKYTQ
ncbi:SBBP repeat-containing protein [bacterium]|nr:SBBP repeat-containing protein [bacterium]